MIKVFQETKLEEERSLSFIEAEIVVAVVVSEVVLVVVATSEECP